MEMRAKEDIDMGHDVTPPIPPLAFSLSDSFLRSHCSACFLPLNPRIPPFLPIDPSIVHPFPATSTSSSSSPSVLYCSPECSKADSDRHMSSGEHHLFLILQSEFTTWQGDTSDLRASLRLLLCFEKLGLLPRQNDLLPNISCRIGGLISNREKLIGADEFDETFSRILEGGRLMSLARRWRDGDFAVEEEKGDTLLEEIVLCQVITNSIEVQVNEGRPLGIAVYGPSFSWINHSCSPNACYRFSCHGSGTTQCSSVESRFRIVASGEVTRTWACEESKLDNGLCGYGPRIIVRSIKAIKKGEEVCVTYTDLLQPKGHVALKGNATITFNVTDSFSNHGFIEEETCKDSAHCLGEAIDEYLSIGDPETSCQKLENILSECLQDDRLKPQERPSSNLQPLHHLSLNAYIILASAYKIRAINLLAIHSEVDYKLEAFNMHRTSTAYSLLLAGAVHHLFVPETSLIVPAANFWISVGESLLSLSRSLTWNLTVEQGKPHSNLISLSSYGCGRCSLMDKLEANLICPKANSILGQDAFNEISKKFLDCISMILPEVWPSLISGHNYLKDICDPVDFRWLRTEAFSSEHSQLHVDCTDVGSSCIDGKGCVSCACEAGRCTNRERTTLFQLGSHCLLYGGYLSTICYGCCSLLTSYSKNLLYNAEKCS
ncbi:PREDICTED: protein SET DOMAIN GROUP 41 isoform X2 [Nelumbo nucifera]|uniref:Protein SET DOMAIN GROUP 41 isoform X2 n=1 Tax=Nelumbo nucifera TaxID=4432 RepID=A0A1U8AF49_NELNU|nr:PREDICTED: protein SET DOMAIN GROUP 41 isoform X2 [Nelumbo nucifera]